MDPNIKQMLLKEHVIEGATRFGISAGELTFIGGFQNFIYSYIRGETKYILRFTPGSLRTKYAITAELEWVHFLAQNGVKVSESVSSVHGNEVECIHGREIDFYVTSFYHAPGRKIGYPECLGNPLLYERCGRITGRLHDLARQFRPAKAKRHTWESNAYLLKAREYLPQECQPILLALDKLKLELAGLQVTSDQFGLIHGDFNVGNFTVDETGEMTLFDFDECQYSWFTEDIAIQLYYLLYVYGEDSKSDRKAQYELFLKYFEQGYTVEGRQLPDNWKEDLALFLRLREIIVVIGMHRSWDLSQPDDWTRDFLRDSRMRITNRLSLIDGL